MSNNSVEPENSIKPAIPISCNNHPAWIRLEDQLIWYDSKSLHCQRMYKRLKFTQIAIAVMIPATSLLPSDIAKWAASISGIVIALLESIQQMNQYSTLWLNYRSTAERLKHEKFLFLSIAGPYRGLSEDDRMITMAERIEEYISKEHAHWCDKIEQTNNPQHSEKN